MFGLLIGLLLVIALIPVSLWFVVKCVRAIYLSEVRKDFAKHPILHVALWIGTMVCVNGIITWWPVFVHH